MYHKGQGVKQDLQQAIYYYIQASKQGDEQAKKALELLGIK